VSGEADDPDAVLGVTVADELADVHRACGGHVGAAGIADVCVVFTDDRLGVRAVMGHQSVERVGHVGLP
jgi:hypothetical protein